MTHEKENKQSKYFGLTKTHEQENGKAEHKAHICCRILYPESKEQLHIGLTGNLIVYNGQKSKFWKIQCLNTWKEAENY